MARYGQTFKDRAVARLLPPEGAAAEVVAREVGIEVGTLRRWREYARLEAVITTAAMSQADKGAWCRERGVYPAELEKWLSSATASLAEPEDARASPQATRKDRKRIKELERELLRKDRALAETAALLVLSKKVEAIFRRGEIRPRRPSESDFNVVIRNPSSQHTLRRGLCRPSLGELCSLLLFFGRPTACGLSLENAYTVTSSPLGSQLRDLSWDDLRIVKAVAIAKSLAAAATATTINQSTVSRRLANIEKTLEVSLFERRRTGYQLTEVGMEVFALAERLELDIIAVTSRLAGLKRKPEGILRIATNDSLALHLLTPICAGFRGLHPGVRIDLFVGNSALNLARGESDVALRATNAPPENLVGRRVATIAWAPYGRASDYASQCIGEQDIYRRAWVTYADGLASLKAALRIEAEVASADIAYRVNTVEGVAAAISAGLGLGYLPCMVGDRQRTLTRVGAIDPSMSHDLWLLTHPDLRKSGRVRAFLEFCAASIARQTPLIEGQSGDRTDS